MRRHRASGRRSRAHCESFRGAQSRLGGRRKTGEGASGFREGAYRSVQVSARDRVSRVTPANRHRQASALPVETMTSPEFPDAAERGSGGKVVHPEGWASPRGFSDAIVAEGKVVAL